MRSVRSLPGSAHARLDGHHAHRIGAVRPMTLATFTLFIARRRSRPAARQDQRRADTRTEDLQQPIRVTAFRAAVFPRCCRQRL
jgi:hypothetical protein